MMPILSERERLQAIADCEREILLLQKSLERTDAYRLITKSQLHRQQIALAALTATPRGYLTWHAIPPTWSDPGGGGEYLAFHESKPARGSDDGTEGWPIFDFPPVPSAPEDE